MDTAADQGLARPRLFRPGHRATPPGRCARGSRRPSPSRWAASTRSPSARIPCFSYQVALQERAARAADLVADAEPRRSHRLHPSQHRPGSRGPSRPRGVDRQVRCRWCSTSSRRRRTDPWTRLLPLAKRVGEKLKARKETVGVSGIVGRRPDLRRAARRARRLGLFHGRRGGLYAPGRRGLPDRDHAKSAPASAPRRSHGRRWRQSMVRERLSTTWGLAETGASGPTGNSYGDPAGHTCVRRGRSQGQDRAHPAHRLERPGRQHARLRRRSAQADGRAVGVTKRLRSSRRPGRRRPFVGRHVRVGVQHRALTWQLD